MLVTIDQSGCICCGLCAGTCPEVFRMSDDGPAEVYAQPAPAQQDTARESAQQCPVSVIQIS